MPLPEPKILAIALAGLLLIALRWLAIARNRR